MRLGHRAKAAVVVADAEVTAGAEAVAVGRRPWRAVVAAGAVVVDAAAMVA